MNTSSYIMKFLLLFTYLTAYTSLLAQERQVAGHLFPRKYKVGDRYRYRLTTEQSYNGKWNATTVVVMELTVVLDSAGMPCDEVRSLSKMVYMPGDTTNKDAEALAVQPYRISLHPDGSIAIPKIEVPGMTGPITDFITFFVAVSPQSRITTLENKGDSLVKKEPVKGNFANGKSILYGEDCLAITAYITDVASHEVKLRTAFLPPAQPCLGFLVDDMEKPVVAGVRNNFQMVQPASPGKYNVQFGNELFYINSTVSRKDGKITAADMSNTLQLSLRINCDSTYKNWQTEIPFHIQRNLKLELLL
ncbi:hypothetical protein D3H65_18480 [Paraflavitalea soli]|uniref:Uncharacterized protein n=1 Tax=Paraflavitalea soli TaxID=2315862 RepID=A0A3B7N006_9BACT|nr:hypothetical protein [Paraflavitalea soli]AXY75851.1 hypothetical protein D3H65_18480 [Paraflavitalea soli]